MASPARQLVDATVGLAGTRAVEVWEEVAWSYCHAYPISPPATLLPHLENEVGALQRVIQHLRDESMRRRLCAPLAKLSAFMAMAVGSSHGDRVEARNWWITARHIADGSCMDLDLMCLYGIPNVHDPAGRARSWQRVRAA